MPIKTISVLINSWNMGNAPSANIETMFEGKLNNDLICIGLQESTYSGSKDCIAVELEKFSKCLGNDYYVVIIDCSFFFENYLFF